VKYKHQVHEKYEFFIFITQITFVQKRKGKVRNISCNECGIRIFVHIAVEPSIKPRACDNVKIVPKADKSEYTCTRKLVERWGAEYSDMSLNSEYFPEPCPIRWLMLDSKNHFRNLYPECLKKAKFHISRFFHVK